MQDEADVSHHPVRVELERDLLYEESSLEKIQAMRFRSNMPVTEIFEVADTVVIGPDPVAVAT